MNPSLPGMEAHAGRLSDIVETPAAVAAAIVKHFKPRGRILDPCRGNGAFSRFMGGCEWCEVREGRDFYAWRQPVDWIVSNPPYSDFANFLRHSLTLAPDVVYLIPLNKVFNSDRLLRDVLAWGGIKEILSMGRGAAMGFPLGYAVGAVHFAQWWQGGTKIRAWKGGKP